MLGGVVALASGYTIYFFRVMSTVNVRPNNDFVETT
jgi:hypothetical protein